LPTALPFHVIPACAGVIEGVYGRYDTVPLIPHECRIREVFRMSLSCLTRCFEPI